MNHNSINLNDLIFSKGDPLMVDPHLIKDVCEAFVHTVLFHRALGIVQPRTVTPKQDSSFKELCYVKCDSQALDAMVASKLTPAVDSFRKDGHGQLQVQFFTSEKGYFGERKGPLWEEWVLSLAVRMEPTLSPAEDKAREKQVEDDVNKILWAVITQVSAARKDLPKVGAIEGQKADPLYYPVEIKAKDVGKREGWVSTIFRGPQLPRVW